MKFGCSFGIFLNSAHLICGNTDISKCFSGSLRLRDNESRLYLKLKVDSENRIKVMTYFFLRNNHKSQELSYKIDQDFGMFWKENPCFINRALSSQHQL